MSLMSGWVRDSSHLELALESIKVGRCLLQNLKSTSEVEEFGNDFEMLHK